MLINLTEYFEVQGRHAEIEVPYEAEKFNDGFKDYDIKSRENLKLSIVNIGDGKLQITGTMNVVLGGECSRCLEPVDVPISLSFEVSVVKPDGYHEVDDDEQYFMNGYELDAETLIDNEMIMSLPMKVLCKETCKGLCPVCGKNRNLGECGCDTFIPDPRMAAISDIFNAIKEV